jgi:hypothetical protein
MQEVSFEKPLFFGNPWNIWGNPKLNFCWFHFYVVQFGGLITNV